MRRNNGTAPPRKAKKSKKTNYIRSQIQDKASRDFPNLSPESIEKYTNIKEAIVELKLERSQLEIRKTDAFKQDRLQSEINHINALIDRKEAQIAVIEAAHSDLENISVDNRTEYINLKLTLDRLYREQRIYEFKKEDKNYDKLMRIKKLIKENELKLKQLN